MCIENVCYPGYDVVDFEINLIFLFKPFCDMTKKSRQKFKYFEDEKSFKVNKSVYIANGTYQFC